MANIQTQSFDQIVSNFATAVQGAASQLIDFAAGAILRAVAQATAGLALWLQGIALQILTLTRFATSIGSDADSWAADFGFDRLAAQLATGAVTFARFTPTNQATIQAATQTGTTSSGEPIWSGGTVVQSADGTKQFQVIPDTTQSAYNAGLNAYVIAASISSCTATVQALVAGSSGNVGAGIITSLGAPLIGVDTVTNAAAFTTGADAESDTAFKARFVLWVASLDKGTPLAIKTAVLSVQQGVLENIVENYLYTGTFQRGNFYVIADDGSGNPPSEFLTAVAAAVEATRPIATTYSVNGPVDVDVTIAITITVASGYNASVVGTAVQAALQAYVDALGLGETLIFTRLYQVAYDASPGVQEITSLTVNSAEADVTCTGQQIIKCPTCTVTT
jgi:uncharacterized phage protein gp47/JayE